MRERATPTGVERTFEAGRVIVSKTDLKGVIRYANRTFLDIARYREDEVIGAPHSIVRHPDMPRGVFRLLWEQIESGQEIFAYVLNLAKDGAHYWVLAHVTPSFSASGEIMGYHSNRRRPDGAAVRSIGEVYRTLLEEERRHRGAREQADAGRAMLGRLLDERGVTYSQFVWSLIGEQAA